MYGSRLYMPLLLLHDFVSPVLSSFRWSISLLKTCCWYNLITSCCAYSSNDIARSVGDNALVVETDGWCLVLEVRIFLYFSNQATNLFLLAQSELKDSKLSIIPSCKAITWTSNSAQTSGSSSWISCMDVCLGHWNSVFYGNSGPLNQTCTCSLLDRGNPCEA